MKNKYTHVLVFEKLMGPHIGDDDPPEYWEQNCIWIDNSNYLYWSKEYQKMWEDKNYRNVNIYRLYET